jgi:hypothetical protein
MNGCDISSSDLILSYKSHIHGLETLIKRFEEVLRRAETAESELIISNRESERKTIEISTLEVTVSKIKIELEKSRKERDEVRSLLELLQREKIRIVEERERERREFEERESKDQREIARLLEEIKKVESERDRVIVEKDKYRREKERFEEEITSERIEFEEKETRIRNEVRKWRKDYEIVVEEKKEIIIELEEIREEKERIVLEFEDERQEWGEKEFKLLEEIQIMEEKFERTEKELIEIRIKLEETTLFLESEREKCTSFSKSTKEFEEQIELLEKSWTETKIREKKQRDELEILHKELRIAIDERERFTLKLSDAQTRIRFLEEAAREEKSEEISKELIQVRAELVRANERLESYLPPHHCRGPKFSIEKVFYCGKVIEDQRVLKEILDTVHAGRSFKPTDELFGGGGSFDSQKTFTVAYHVNGKGPLRFISVPEGGSVRF